MEVCGLVGFVKKLFRGQKLNFEDIPICGILNFLSELRFTIMADNVGSNTSASTGVMEIGCEQTSHKDNGIVYWAPVSLGIYEKGELFPSCTPTPQDLTGDKINVSAIDERHGGAVHETCRGKTLTISRGAYNKVCGQPPWDKIKQLVQDDPKNKVFSTTLLILLGALPHPARNA